MLQDSCVPTFAPRKFKGLQLICYNPFFFVFWSLCNSSQKNIFFTHLFKRWFCIVFPTYPLPNEYVICSGGCNALPSVRFCVRKFFELLVGQYQPGQGKLWRCVIRCAGQSVSDPDQQLSPLPWKHVRPTFRPEWRDQPDLIRLCCLEIFSQVFCNWLFRRSCFALGNENNSRYLFDILRCGKSESKWLFW